MAGRRDIIRHWSSEMTTREVIYLIPYLISLTLSLAILFYAYKKRHTQSAYPFFWYVLGQTLWIAGFILELTSADVRTKIFWDGFQWICGLAVLVSIPVFAVTFTEYKLFHPRRMFILSLLLPGLFALLVVSDSAHQLLYANARLTSADPFAELLYDFTLPVYVYAAYSYIVVGWGIVLLVRSLIRPHKLYRAQLGIVILGFAIPILSSGLSVFGIQLTPERDPLPFSAALGNLVIAWGLFRFRLFEVTPIARDKVFESLADPVVILDKKSQVVDINTAMLDLLGMKAEQVIGHSAKQVFETFQIPIKQYTQVSYARAETSFEINKTRIHYELTVWPLFNIDKQMEGRIYICHDITALKELENELRILNLDLESRVQLRTRELAEAYESTLEGLARALELRDKETEGHSRRVTENTLKIAQRLGINTEALEDIRSGAILHDIGKISIPDEILHKPGKLTPGERAIVEQHPETAFKLLSRIPFLSKAIEIPYCHHEKWDGTGYPRKLTGEDIPLSARIFAVADVWDALSNDRIYNKAWPREEIVAYFQEQTGKHFDPAIARLFLLMVERGEI